MNFECTWPSDPTFAVDLGGPGALRHLLDDIQLAEELGIRYGDQNSGRRVAVVFGIAVRLGGPVNVTLGRQLRETCTSSLFKTVAETHSISTEDIGRMRTRLSERGANLPVTVPVTLLYLWLSLYAIRRIRDRFEIDEALPVAVAVLLASIAVTAAVIWLPTCGGLAWRLCALETSISVTGRVVGRGLAERRCCRCWRSA